MNKRDYAGWKDVFAFSFVQGVKDKSFRGFLIICSLILLLALPVSTWFKNRDTALVDCSIEKITVYNESGLPIEVSTLLKDQRYSGVEVTTETTLDYDAYVKQLEESKYCKETLVKLEYVEDMACFRMLFVKAASSGISDKDYNQMVEDFQTGFQEARKQIVEVTKEQEEMLAQSVDSQVSIVEVDENGNIMEEEDDKVEGVSLEEYTILLAANVIVVFLISFTGGSIANSVVTEKSTRVVEYLMINVRPMALIVGKILASILQVVIQFAVLGCCYGLSWLITNSLFGMAHKENAGTLEMVYGLLAQVSPLYLVVSLAVIIFGVLFFCIVAGLAGASVSKLEELAEGMKLYQLCMVGGSYLGLGLCIVEMIGGVSSTVINAFCLVPIAAPFVIPANLLLGKISIIVALIGLALLVLITILLFSFTAKVYEAMIFYNGSVLKLKDIISIAKNRGRGRKEAK